MTKKLERELRKNVKRAAEVYKTNILDPARYNWLNEKLRQAEESGDMVKQNLIMQEMAKLEMGV